jgi:aminopeptidase YwaD
MTRTQRATVALALFLSIGSAGRAQSPVPNAIGEAILQELRGKIALDHIYQLATWHRSVGSRDYHEAALYIEKAARDAGLSNVEILKFPQDGGKTRVLDTYQTGYAWEITGAELTVVGSDHPICRYEDVPTCVAESSAPIDTTADLVDVGEGLSDADYAGKIVRDKLVLASGQAAAVLAFGRKRLGILGVVSYWENFDPDRSAFPDQVPWQAVPQEPLGALVAFSVSARTAVDLKRQLARGTVRLRARIESRLYEGEAEIVTGVIPGATRPQEEVLFTSHLNHHKPGANDNASGCALNLEIARVLTRLLTDGRLPRPQRTVRFLWLPEHRGPQLYLDRFRDYASRGVAVINNDMVGEDQQKCNSTFVLVRTPDSLPTYLNDLVESLIEEVARKQFRSPFGSRNIFHYRVEPYSGGISDHYYFVDGSIRVPALLLNFAPDNFYHSNEDTPDRCDASSLMRVGYVGATVGLYLASAGAAEGRLIAAMTASAGLARIGRLLGDALQALATGGDLNASFRDYRNRLMQAGRRELAAVRSVTRLADALVSDTTIEDLTLYVSQQSAATVAAFETAYRAACKVRGIAPEQPKRSTEEERATTLVPRRKLYGPLRLTYLLERLPPARRLWHERVGIPTLLREEILNFIDGRRSVLDIRDAVAGEFGPIDLGAVQAFLEDLKTVGLVEGMDVPRAQ